VILKPKIELVLP